MNVKKSLASWLSVVLSATCMMSSMPVSAATNVTPGSEVNWAFEQPYKTNVTQFHNVKSDPDLKKLTDGVFMGRYEYDDNIVGFKEPNGESAAFEIDLGVTKDVKRVVVSCFDNATYGINPAATTVFEYYDEASSAWKALETVQTTSPYTGNYDDGDGVGFGMVAIQSAKTFSGSKVRVSFSGNSSWVMIDEIEVIGGADPNKPFMPIFTKDLNPQKTLSAGEALSLAAEATKGDDGVLSYQWYKDDAPIDGATQDTYTIDSAQGTDSGRYKVEAINTKNGLTQSAFSKNCLVKVVSAQSKNLLLGIPFTTSMAVGNPNDPGGTKGNYVDNDQDHPSAFLLTDSIRQDEKKIMDPEVGRYNKIYGSLMYADFTFDLGSVQSFAQVNLSTLAGSYGVKGPMRLQIMVSNDTGADKQWNMIFDGPLKNQDTHKEYVIATKNNKQISTQFLKLHVFFGDGTWIAIDEIELYNQATGDKADGTIGSIGEETEDQANNLALNCSYTSSKNSPTDTHKLMLTDGQNGNVIGDNWVDFPTSAGNVEVIVDLGAEVSFQQVDASFLTDLAGTARRPEWIRTEYSTNKSSWTLLDETTLGEDPAAETKAYPYKAAASGTLQARYVKITVPNSTDVYMDEIKVLKEKTLVISTPDAESLDPNDIAIGCSYTTAWACNGNYADRGRDLTNGRRAPLRFSSPEWVGFHSNDGAAVGLTDFYVTVDLGAVKTFEQVKFGALSESAPGILPPSGAKIESSTDNTNWTLLTEEPTNFSGGDSVGRFCYSAKEPVSARYVRIHMVIPYNWLFIDEIEVLEKNDPLPDANVVPSNGREINLMRDYQSYTSSRPPEINDISGLLTDGKHGVTYTKYDKNWMGYQYNNTNADQNHVVLDFDLYAAASISQILICSKQDAEKQFILPKNLKLFISSDEEKWYEIKSFDGNMTSETLVWDGKVDAFKTANKTATMIYARYVRAEFDVPAGSDTVYLDEVKIMGKLGRCAESGIINYDDTGAYNIAEGKAYQLLPTDMPSNAYSDPTGKKLTDGLYGTDSMSSAAWVGLRFRHYGDIRAQWPMASIIVDLEDAKTIKAVTYNLLGARGAGIIPPPSSRTYLSMDGNTWVPLSRTSVGCDQWDKDGINTFGWHNPNPQLNGGETKDLVPEHAMLTARYVRVDVELSGWHFIDEISVMGYDEQLEGAPLADYGTHPELGKNYQRSGEKIGGVQDMVLCYNGWYGVDGETNTPIGDFTVDKYRPLLTYIDRSNQAVDTMFDTVLLLALKSRYGRSLTQLSGEEGANATDWEWYLDKSFAENGDVANLNEAAKRAAKELNDPNYKVKLTIMSPTPIPDVKNFGSLKGSRSLDMSVKEDRDFATDWWIEQVLAELKKGDYPYIDFTGFYWMSESATEGVSDILYFTDAVHKKELKTFWIPHFGATGQFFAEDFGFDGVTYQPHHAFDDPYASWGWGELLQESNNPLMDNFAKRCSYANLGAEFEIEGSAYTQPGKYNQYIDYLNTAVDYGYDGPGFHRDYYNASAYYTTASSGNATIRTLYEYTYQMMRGTYTKKEYVVAEHFPLNPDIGGLYRNNGVTDPSLENNTEGSSSGSVSGKPTTKPTVPEKPTQNNFTWEKVNGAWKLKGADGKYATGWNKIGNTWYYLNASGVMQTGWNKIGDTWYYLNASGSMKTGWAKIGNNWYYLKESGAMVTGWRWVGNQCYYFDQNGKMASNTTIGGYKVGANGAWIH